jgi:hypothetical protein
VTLVSTRLIFRIVLSKIPRTCRIHESMDHFYSVTAFPVNTLGIDP